MLVMGHRGARGLAPENTLEAMKAGVEAGADILEFDVRLTKDRIPVLNHDFHTLRTHRDASIISRHTLAELRERTKKQPIVPLSSVLDAYFGKVILNIEIKGHNTGKVVAELVKRKYIKRKSDWDTVLFSSFRGSELLTIRKLCPEANLALLHSQNPFIFIAFHRRLHLTAIGFHRLYINPFALEIAKRAGLFTYVYTVNRPHTALMLAQQGIDGVVSDRPDTVLNEIRKNAG